MLLDAAAHVAQRLMPIFYFDFRYARRVTSRQPFYFDACLRVTTLFACHVMKELI